MVVMIRSFSSMKLRCICSSFLQAGDKERWVPQTLLSPPRGCQCLLSVGSLAELPGLGEEGSAEEPGLSRVQWPPRSLAVLRKVRTAAPNTRVVLGELGKGVCLMPSLNWWALPLCTCAGVPVREWGGGGGEIAGAKPVRTAAGEPVTKHFFLVPDFG